MNINVLEWHQKNNLHLIQREIKEMVFTAIILICKTPGVINYHMQSKAQNIEDVAWNTHMNYDHE